MKRIVLFLVTNLAVMLVLSVVLSVLGVDRFLTENGINVGMLLVFFADRRLRRLVHFIADVEADGQVVDRRAGDRRHRRPEQRWLVDTVRRLADKAGIGMPEVAFYEGEPNAFATGAFKNSALVAVSTGLLQAMSRDEVEAVLGHEVSHVANGDMVTLTLIQGVVNTFVVFLARVVGYIIDKAVFKTERGIGPGYYITVIVCEIVFSVLASLIVAWFSRQREFRADAGSARLLGSGRPMINALARLGGLEPGALPQVDRHLRHHRQAGLHGAVLDPSADRGAHRGAAGTP